MPPRLSVSSMSLPELLRHHDQYAVPAHQRVYGWGEAQVERLLTDCGVRVGARNQVSIAGNLKPWLFLGTIYLSRRASGSAVDIADGQQRVVTATMLYAVARDLEEDATRRAALAEIVEVVKPKPGHGADRFRLVLKDVDAAFFRQWVQEPGATLIPYVGLSARRSLSRQGGSFSDGSDAPSIGDGLDDAEDDDANDRHSLRTLSESQCNIIENRDFLVLRLRALSIEARRRLIDSLAAYSELVVITAPTIDVAREAYASTYTRGLRQAETDSIKAEVIGGADASVRANLAHHWDECEASLGKDGLEDLLSLLVLIKTHKKAKLDLQTALLDAFDLPHDLKSFIEDVLVPYAAAYRDVLEASVATSSRFFKPVSDRSRVKKINGHLVALMRLGHSEWRAPAIVALRTMRGDLDRLETVLAGLERLASLNAIVGVDSAQATERYSGVARAIATDPKSVESSLALTQNFLDDAREQLLSDTVGTKARYRMLVLLKLNDIVANEVIKIHPRSVSVEHVLPQNTSKGSGWRGTFRHAKSKKYTGSDYVNRLGNLTILGHADNRNAGNEDFVVKRSILLASTHALAKEAGSKKNWNAGTITMRGEALFKALVRHWDL